MSNPIAVGDLAPDFTLKGYAHGEVSEYTLSARRGQPVVLAFYPADSSAVCTKQLCSYSDNLEAFNELDAVVWGISTKDVDSKKDFAEGKNVTIPLLADVDAHVAEAYGVHGKLGVKRAIFIVDAEGRVAWSHIAPLGITYQSTAKLTEALRSLTSPTQ